MCFSVRQRHRFGKFVNWKLTRRVGVIVIEIEFVAKFKSFILLSSKYFRCIGKNTVFELNRCSLKMSV